MMHHLSVSVLVMCQSLRPNAVVRTSHAVFTDPDVDSDIGLSLGKLMTGDVYFFLIFFFIHVCIYEDIKYKNCIALRAS